MRNVNTLDLRLTRKYVTDYSHLDSWNRVGTYSVLRSRCVRQPDDFDDGGDYLIRLRVDSKASDDDIIQAIADHFQTTGCSHEYDCCGCTIRYATRIWKDKRKEWLATIRIGYNY